ncbi:MarR family winged helix-turn-helix transcriptional regulator [Nocardia otitidiscaviarum]|uniref:MarR family winged helix-turn-helix transcriptional regulator n=1 Tax=Nocardia otitidiscaviarum TaxID=1823 RepID=UPI001E2CD7A3|nr:MarR family transcriptional regulator [Nocardia otitidiscaviarum]
MYMQSNGAKRVSRGGISAAWSKVAALTSAVDANLDRWLADSYRVGLTEFRALSLVSQSPEKELRVNDLAQAVGLNQSSATRLVTRLESKGYVRRDLCADDKRGVYAVITEDGEALVRRARSPYEDRITELLTAAPAHFPGVDIRQLGAALREIETLLDS